MSITTLLTTVSLARSHDFEKHNIIQQQQEQPANYLVYEVKAKQNHKVIKQVE